MKSHLDFMKTQDSLLQRRVLVADSEDEGERVHYRLNHRARRFRSRFAWTGKILKFSTASNVILSIPEPFFDRFCYVSFSD